MSGLAVRYGFYAWVSAVSATVFAISAVTRDNPVLFPLAALFVIQNMNCMSVIGRKGASE